MDERSDFARSEYANDSSEEISNTKQLGWDRWHRRYWCKDGVALEVPKTTAIWYGKSKNAAIPREKLFISKVEFSRDMREIIESEDTIRTIIFPKTVRTVKQKAFFKNHKLVSTVANEGLETLGTDEYKDDGGMGSGVFENSGLKRIKLSSTIKRIEYSAFENCKDLKNIQLPDKLVYVGKRCFC